MLILATAAVVLGPAAVGLLAARRLGHSEWLADVCQSERATYAICATMTATLGLSASILIARRSPSTASCWADQAAAAVTGSFTSAAWGAFLFGAAVCCGACGVLVGFARRLPIGSMSASDSNLVHTLAISELAYTLLLVLALPGAAHFLFVFPSVCS